MSVAPTDGGHPAGGGDPAEGGADVALSVILCTHNGARAIDASLDAILAQEWDQPWELIVVDNDSDDDTPARLRDRAATHARLRVVRADRRRSAPYARNQGVRAARGRNVAFVDDDDIVAPGWLAALGRALTDHPVVAMKVDVDQINPAHVAATRSPPQATGVSSYRGIPTVSTQMAVRRDWYLGLGGFDESIPGPAGEDTDFGIRLWLRHRTPPFWAEDAVCHYRLRDGRRALLRQGFRYGRVHPMLHRRWDAECPEPARPASVAVKEWIHLAGTAVPSLLDPQANLRWYFRVGIKAGRVAGSIQARTLHL